jgi:prepilin-type N-terminal cleavage/methylation domain-containing protein
MDLIMNQQPPLNRANGYKTDSASGFSLTELLVVIAIMAMLTVIGLPALSALSTSGGMNETVAELGGLLDQARQYAVAQNTYVWVAFYPNTSATEGNTLTVAIVASKDGTDPSPWADYGTIPSDTLGLMGRVKTFKQIKLSDAGAFTADLISTLPTSPAVDSANNLADNTAVFHIKLPGATAATSFTRAIQFTPRGEVRNNSNPIDIVEFGVQPQKHTTSDAHNVAVIRINGTTGQTLVYRP